MDQILVAGSGLTGALCARLLKHDKAQINIWDKSKGCGGRMSTSRSSTDGHSTVDLGAQYISTTPDDFKSHNRFYKELTQASILTPLKGAIEGMETFGNFPKGTQHFVTPMGVNSIVKHYVQESGANVCFGERIVDISEANGKWHVKSESGRTDAFNQVILTMPVPQIIQLHGSIAELIDSQPDIKEQLQKVTYSSRFAMALFYDPGNKIDVPWCAKYFIEEPSVRFIAIDNKKRGIENSNVGPTIAVHAGAPFSIKHIDEDTNDVCSQMILPTVRKLLPHLPEHSAVKNHKWRYSQVHEGYKGSPGAIILMANPLLVLAGDAFTRSGFDGCIDSALKTVDLFQTKTM